MILFILMNKFVFAQRIVVDTVGKGNDFENISNTKVFSDSLSSSFVIQIKKEIKEHKHANHSEHIYILEGIAQMTLGDSAFQIQPGDLVFIQQNVFHSVKTTSLIPLKLISIQAPNFDGSDRIYK